MSICDTEGHSWAPIGLPVEGALHLFCRRPDCKAEARQVWQLVEGPGMSIDGIALDIKDDPQGAVAKTVCREAEGQYNDLDLQPGDVVVDIGAHVGIISIYLAKRYPGVRIYAYEPAYENYRRLIRNRAANNVVNCIETQQYAITGDGRTVQVQGDLSVNSGGGSVYGSGANLSDGESLTLADVFRRHAIDHLALLKIDCESAEYEILVKHQELLDRVTYLRGEFHPAPPGWENWNQERLLALCRQHIKPENIRVSFQGG